MTLASLGVVPPGDVQDTRGRQRQTGSQVDASNEAGAVVTGVYVFVLPSAWARSCLQRSVVLLAIASAVHACCYCCPATAAAAAPATSNSSVLGHLGGSARSAETDYSCCSCSPVLLLLLLLLYLLLLRSRARVARI
jgi:hypothetical protein